MFVIFLKKLGELYTKDEQEEKGGGGIIGPISKTNFLCISFDHSMINNGVNF